MAIRISFAAVLLLVTFAMKLFGLMNPNTVLMPSRSRSDRGHVLIPRGPGRTSQERRQIEQGHA